MITKLILEHTPHSVIPWDTLARGTSAMILSSSKLITLVYFTAEFNEFLDNMLMIY